MTTKVDFEKWLQDNLSSVLSFPVPSDMIQYIIGIENERDVDDYLQTLLDLSDPRHRQFIENFKIIRHVNVDAKGYRKEQLESDQRKIKTSKQKNSQITTPPPAEEKVSKDSSSKKKSKFVNLYSSEGRDVVLLKGRHFCDCQASIHRLINNCLKCGRIVCEQEGSGNCLYCNTLVCSNEEQQIINSRTEQSKLLYDNLINQSSEAAIKQRDRLLEYDRTSERRTKVIDDEGEYYSSSSVWLSPEERKRIKQIEDENSALKHGSRVNKRITLDFAGRQVLEDEPKTISEEYYQQMIDEVYNSLSTVNIHPGISEELRPTFISDSSNTNYKFVESYPVLGNNNPLFSRVQDKQYLEMSDRGACLSMHQPWASLLVLGIKRDEGRTWYTSHRGRLWIAAASKTPNQDEVIEIENIYKGVCGDNIKFPDTYPTSCLLGCVDIIDCLPQEEYRLKYPDGESESPFVLVCRNPQALSIKFPVSGAHKIYKLDSKIHEAAQKSLLRMKMET